MKKRRGCWTPQKANTTVSDRKYPQETRKKARQAHNFLMQQDIWLWEGNVKYLNEELSAYRKFVEERNTFMESNPEASERKRKRPNRFLEQVGLECALWPHLFWSVKMCETYERASDSRRLARTGRGRGCRLILPQARQQRAKDQVHADDSDSEVDLDTGVEERHSAKTSFMAKLLSPVLGYGNDYKLLQYLYDLSMFSALGGAKNAQRHIPLRVLLKGAKFSPAYWKVRHYALLDLQRQLGYPTLFITIAPYEWSFPYHEWVLDEMTKQLRARLHLAGAETLHITQVT